MARAFRFGVSISTTGSSRDLLDRVAAVEAAGADSVLIPDHLGMLAPLPTLVAAAMHAPRLRVGTFVLNAGFYTPALLARDVATVARLTGGRFDVGIGAGSGSAEAEAVGLEARTTGQRIDHLAETVRSLRRELGAGSASGIGAETPAIVIGGSGPRVLALAAREADAIALSKIVDRAELADRVALVRDRAGDRGDDLELGLSLFDLGVDRPADVERVRFGRRDASENELRRSMNLVAGSLDEVVAHLVGLRDEFAISTLTLSQPDPRTLADFARVIARLREIDGG